MSEPHQPLCACGAEGTHYLQDYGWYCDSCWHKPIFLKSTLAYRALTPEQQRIHTAYHEAGHTFVAWSLYMPVCSASLVRDGDAAGSVWLGASPLTRPMASAHMTICAAGNLAVKRFCAISGWDQAVADHGVERDAGQSFGYACWKLGITDPLNKPGETREEWQQRVLLPAITEIEWEMRRCERMLENPRNWHAVEILACALLDQTSLTEAQVLSLIQAALPEFALD